MTTVINNPGNNEGGSGGWAVVVIIILVLVGGFLIYRYGWHRSAPATTNINVTVPNPTQ